MSLVAALNAGSKARRSSKLEAAPSAVPAVRLLPFGAAALPNHAVPPAEAREAGRLLYVGTAHPVARAGVVWFLRRVMPHLDELSGAVGAPLTSFVVDTSMPSPP